MKHVSADAVKAQGPSPTETKKTDRDTETRDKQLERNRMRAARRLRWLTLVVLIAAVAWGAMLHLGRSSQAEAALEAHRTNVPLVRVLKVKTDAAPTIVDLPGTMQAFDSATLYARATGYIAVRNVDIGSKVKKGGVLAVISAPDLDQQLAQGRATLKQLQAALDQAKANQQLANVTNKRTATLVGQGWTSKQQGDTDRSNFNAQTAAVAVALANIQAQQAQVRRLEELAGFEKVTAPYDGTIISRQIDVGNLVTADAASGTPLFAIARTDVLRVQVYVPQEYVFGLKDGSVATLTVPQLPGREFKGTVARNAHALSQNTRTLLTEIDVDNKDETLSAGLYGVVHLHVPRDRPVIFVPSEAVFFNKDGLHAAVFENGVVRIRKLTVASDDGAQVGIRDGLKPDENVILNPPVNLAEGMKVERAPEPTGQARRP